MTKPMKLKYFTCENHQHDEEALNYVCIEKQCESVGLLCSICRIKHADHKVIPLKFLLQGLRNHSESPMQPESFQGHIQKIQQIKNYFLYQLRICVESLAQKFQILESELMTQFKKIKVELLEQVQLSMKFNQIIQKTINNQINSKDQFISDFARIASLIKTNSTGNEFSFIINLNQITEEYQMYQKIFQVNLEKVQSVVTSALDQCCNFKNIRKQSKKINENNIQVEKKNNCSFSFSSTAKGYENLQYSKSISLSNQLKIATQTSTTSTRFALINQCMGEKKQKIGFKVKSLKNWVGLGIAIRDKLQALQYHFNYNNLGHGSYLVSSNGYSWSHSEKQDNLHQITFKFLQNDIIDMELEPKELIFTNRNSKQKFKMKINLNEKQWKFVCFCVNLCSKDDAVQIC